MAKRAKRPSKALSLTRAKTYPDPHHPWAMHTRGEQYINISGLMRDPKTGLLYDGGTPPTITHGKRGLTIARAHGPTAVGFMYEGKPTMIPKMEVQLRKDEVVALAKNPKGDFEHWNHVNYHRYRDENGKVFYELDLFFHGLEFIWVEREGNVERRSRSYRSKVDAELRLRPGRKILWDEVIPIPNSS